MGGREGGASTSATHLHSSVTSLAEFRKQYLKLSTSIPQPSLPVDDLASYFTEKNRSKDWGASSSSDHMLPPPRPLYLLTRTCVHILLLLFITVD